MAPQPSGQNQYLDQPQLFWQSGQTPTAPAPAQQPQVAQEPAPITATPEPVDEPVVPAKPTAKAAGKSDKTDQKTSQAKTDTKASKSKPAATSNDEDEPDSKVWIVVLALILVLALIAGAVFWFIVKPRYIDAPPPTTSASVPANTPTAPVIDGKKTRMLKLEVGDCFDSANSTPDYNFAWVLDCSASHDSEVYHVGQVPDPGSYPTPDLWTTYATGQCAPDLVTYLGDGWVSDKINLMPMIVYPSQSMWESGDRTLVCWVQDMDGPINQSVTQPHP